MRYEDDALAEKPATEQRQGIGATRAKRQKNASSPNDVGTALRQAFQATVQEEIPDELLDLLRRLD